MQIEVIATESLGNRGYIVHDGQAAIAIDVQRDYGRWLSRAEELAVSITHVVETHMHNDYVTGGYRLAQRLGATYVIPEGSDASFEAYQIKDSQEILVGGMHLLALHTPGHTEHHMSYRVSDEARSAVFTGGGVLYGTVGRSDLVSPDKTELLTEAQYSSAQRLSKELSGETEVFPTHGFGSFCSSSDGTGASSSTIADELRNNIVYTSASKQAFIDTILAGLGPYPRYYAHMGPLNRSGPDEVAKLELNNLTDEKLSELLENNEWVIDLRQRKLFAANHPRGAAGFELGNSFATYVGWLIPWDAEITLVADTKDDLAKAHEELSRIGMETHIAGTTTDLDSYMNANSTSSYQVKTFNDLAMEVDSHSRIAVLDVRLTDDWEADRVKDSINIPLHELQDGLGELPDDKPIWVHCASGYRASIAASLLDRAAKQPVLIDDDFAAAVDLGLTVRGK